MVRGRVVDMVTAGRWRRRRWMRRRLEELDRLDAGLSLRPRRRGAPTGVFVAVGTLALVLVGTAALARSEFGVTVGLAGLDGDGPQRLAPPATPPARGGAHAFLHVEFGSPVGYDPCEHVRVVVNDTLEPAGAGGLVEEAVATVAAATGLAITVVGTSDELPSRPRSGRDIHLDGIAGHPVLVAWTTAATVPDLAGETAGIGGSSATSTGARGLMRYTSGVAALDAEDLSDVLEQPRGRALVRAVILHELAHVVGLDHVEDPRELMNEENVGLTGFGPGDLQGLAALGSISCG